MADSSHRAASFLTQANALFRKNLIFQRRNMKTNIRLILFPLFLSLLVLLIQTLIENALNGDPDERCGCSCIDKNADGSCKRTVCGIAYSDLEQAGYCPIRRPQEWPALLQVPDLEERLPNKSCRQNDSCPATILLTGGNRSLGESVARNFFTGTFTPDSSDMLHSFANIMLGSSSAPAF
ncbi:ABC transporter A family member 7-like isoform X2 [Telopea speciosissima]|uniref:ABC transporter A family member 7-like isoform X2 n=1 Tax=Telopea speciosissima TaxID=54955 RepID=UPI001CC6D190|nr:ABC transporter A family member 7-like isoform X2 [Telopea speciosissima]